MKSVSAKIILSLWIILGCKLFKSPLRYPGGKSRAVDIISPLIPKYSQYREPFLGGGSIFLNEKQKHPKRQFILNDLYEDLFLFWKYSQKSKPQLLKQILEWRANFTNGKELYVFLNTNYTNFNELEKAAAFFIYNRITFSGTTLSGGFSESAFHNRFTESSIKRLELFSDIIQGAEIYNLDYEEIIKMPGDDVFIFLDPPYYSATKSALYGKNGNMHKSFDHQRFADVMKKCSHKWLITYDDSEYIRDLFSFAYIQPWNLKYGMRNITESSDQNGKELFISNYLQEYYSKGQFNMFEEFQMH